MVYSLLVQLRELLEAAGIPAGEEYPAGERVEIHNPVAVVGLRELDCANAVARFSGRALSPRILGGWCCQRKAALAALSESDGSPERFTAGELTVQRGSASAAARCLRGQAELMMMPYVRDSFAYLGV